MQTSSKKNQTHLCWTRNFQVGDIKTWLRSPSSAPLAFSLAFSTSELWKAEGYEWIDGNTEVISNEIHDVFLEIRKNEGRIAARIFHVWSSDDLSKTGPFSAVKTGRNWRVRTGHGWMDDCIHEWRDPPRKKWFRYNCQEWRQLKVFQKRHSSTQCLY